MHKYLTRISNDIFLPVLLSTGAVLAVFILQGSQGFNLMDEGFLWYGAQRVMLGEVPVRDFMAYDPGRYYWSAISMSILQDDGIMALRISVAVFQGLGLLAGLILIARNSVKLNIPFLFVATVILTVWMSPRHKLFDISLSIFLLVMLSMLVEKPTLRRYFLTGIVTGIVAVFGRNHGIYGMAGFLGTMLYITLREITAMQSLKGLSVWAGGISMGYLPLLLMLALVPGFAGAFWESISFLFDIRQTNLPKPVPWPWRTSFEISQLTQSIRTVLTGLFFILIVVYGGLGIIWAFIQKWQKKPPPPTLIASVFLALPYAHFAFSRADINHLSQGIFPFIIGAMSILAGRTGRIKWAIILLLLVSSLWLMLPVHPGWQCMEKHKCVDSNVAGDILMLKQETADDLRMLERLADEYAPGNHTFMAAPLWPGAYAVLGRKSPVWEIYALFPRSETFQQREIERIKAADPGFIIIQDYPLDGRDELRYQYTHPFIYQFIQAHYAELEKNNTRGNYLIFTRNPETR